MANKTIVKDFTQTLQKAVEGYGFVYNKRDESYQRSTLIGWEAFAYICLDYKTYWVIEPSIRIRINSVEDLYHESSGFEPRFQKGTPTIAAPISKIINETCTQRLDENNIAEVVNYFDLHFHKHALPFFEKYREPQNIEHLINSSDVNADLYSGPIDKGSHALILAYLYNRGIMKNVYEKYLLYYQKFSKGFYLRRYEELAKHLGI
jgi:hypothetical protein